jgi:uncharacterized membrane protein
MRIDSSGAMIAGLYVQSFAPVRMSTTPTRALPGALAARLRSFRFPALRRPGVPALVRQEPLLFALVAVFAFAYAAYNTVRFPQYLVPGYDLSIFDQTIWRYSHFELPKNTIRGFDNILGDHFSPILVVLAPLYWIWTDPRMLFAAQGLLIAAAIVPIFLFARPRIGRVPSSLLAVAYALFWGISAAVAFDFHEVAFAPLLIALVVLFIDQRRWRAYWISLFLLLCVKEDMPVVVVFVGLYLLVLREFRVGLITVAVGVAWYELATAVIMPALAGKHGFQYWWYGEIGSSPLDAIGNSIKHPGLLPHFLIDNPAKAKLILYLLVPFLFLILYSPLVLLAIPLIAERVYSTNTGLLENKFHYSLAIASVLALGAADGLRNLVDGLGWRRWMRPIAIVATGAMVVGGFILAKRYPLYEEVHSAFWSTSKSEVNARYDRALARIPPDASVMSLQLTLSHLAERDQVYGIKPETPLTDYIVVNLSNYFLGPFPLESFSALQRVVTERLPHYDQIFKAEGDNPTGGHDAVFVFRLKSLRRS